MMVNQPGLTIYGGAAHAPGSLIGGRCRATLKTGIGIGLLLLMVAGCEASPPPPASAEVSRGGVRLPLAAGEAPAQLYQDSYALVIGASAYTSGWPTLPGALDDMTTVSAALQNQGFKVTTVPNPDHAQLRQAFDKFIIKHGQEPQNRLLIYFAGHGDTRKLAYGQEMGYILPVDAPLYDRDAEGFLQTALDMEQIGVYARRIQAKHALFVFDSCFSGSLFSLARAAPAEISRKTAQPVRQFITSGGADEVVSDRSVFRDQFLTALQGEADYNHDGYVTGSELGSFLQDKVANYSRNSQHPQYGKLRDPMLDKGDLVFVVGVTTGGSGPLDAKVELEFWEAIKDRRDPKLFREYRERWPNGKFATEVELEFWKAIKDRRDPKLFREYRERWPQGEFATIAQVRLAELETTPAKPEPPAPVVEPPPVAPPARPAPASTPVPAPPPATVAAPSRQDFEPELVRIAGGCFQMGSPKTEKDRDSNERQHQVCVRDFEIGKFEVTQRQWQAVMGNNPSYFTGCADCPVEQINWTDIQAYLTELNGRTGKDYRLPTEAEWEYAARAGTTTAFWTGRCVTTAQANYDGNYGYGNPDCGAKTGVYRGKTLPVDSFKANPWGLYDTMGNVLEWTCSEYDEKYGGAEQECSNKDTTGARAVRGGSWDNLPDGVRSALRGRLLPDPPRRQPGFPPGQILITL